MTSDSLKLFAKLFIIVIAIFMISFYLFIVFLEPALYYFTPDGVNATTVNFSNPLTLWILNMPLRVYTGLNLGAIFFGLWIAFAASFVVAWKLRKSLPKVIKESVHKPTRKLFSNCLFAMPFINSMTLLVVMIIQSIQETGGIPTGTAPSQGDMFLVLFDRSYASVIEEIGFRLIPIGAFLIFMFMMKKEAWEFSLKQKIKLFFAGLLFPDTAKRMVGAKTVEEHGLKDGISLGEWGVVVFTAVIFGLAHYNPGVSWEIGKISSAAFTGLVLGLVYLVYGIQASIIMHWFFNVYSTTFVLISDMYPATAPFVDAIWMITLAVGIIGLVAIANMGVLKLITAIEKRGKNKQNQSTLSQQVSPL
ncbi:MAG: hypothetical protein CW716_05655 [Candidatus Bathyarchaeum sp.]|nr:MAG: hypothetical protein CW716_05655 [Candidatus Bathyarchaeum sp.]